MRRLLVVLGPASLLAVSALAVVSALLIGGAAEELAILDPGPAVRWGLPIARLAADLSAGVTLGGLILAALALSPREREFARALDLVAGAAAVWTVAAGATALLNFANVTGLAPTLAPEYGDAIATFLTGTELGRAWLFTAILGAVITVAAFVIRHHVAVALMAIVTGFGLIPLAEQGHTGGTADHNIAVTALWIHIVFAGVWLGGLVTLAVVSSVQNPARVAAVLPRYSSIALVSFTVVAISGIASASLRIETPGDLLSGYGALLTLKTVALVGLGAFGAVQRTRIISRLDALRTERRARLLALLVVLELGLMGLASGVAAALGRTSPPYEEIPADQLANPTPAELLTGAPLPPELTLDRWVTSWEIDLLWVLVCGFLAFFYLAGVWRLHRRGDRWPIGRTILWILGLALLAWTTNGAMNVYQEYLFSIHMLEHMLLTMMVPVLLVLAAPITLALRTIERRTDASRGPREWILLLVHSRYLGVLTNPFVAAGLFAGSLWVFYYTPLLRWAMADHVGHEWMIIHFLITGYLFASVLIGVDPVGNQPPYPLRLLLLLATMGFHAFFGIAIMESEGLFLADWYGAMGREWGLPPLEDQVWGGGIAWSVGEIPTVALAIMVAVMWGRSDEREQKRRDRAADRDGEAELAAYNAALQRAAERDATRG